MTDRNIRWLDLPSEDPSIFDEALEQCVASRIAVAAIDISESMEDYEESVFRNLRRLASSEGHCSKVTGVFRIC